MDILVVGSAGFIGRYLTKRLTAAGHKVIGFDLTFDKAQGEMCECVVGNICNKENIIRALKDRKIDIIINLAAKHRDFGISEEEFFEVNEKGIRNLVECAAIYGIKKFLFFSSVAVYGSHKEAVTEDTMPSPVSQYGKSKLAAEKVLEKWAEEDKTREVLIIRPVVAFGPWNYANMYHLIKKIRDRKFVFIGKGTNIKSVAYVENLVEATVFLLDMRKPSINYFNYSDEPQMSIREIVDVISRHVGVRVPESKMPLFLALILTFPFDVLQKITGRVQPITAKRIKKFSTPTHFKADKIREAGFVQPISLEEGFKRTLEWFLREEDRNLDN